MGMPLIPATLVAQNKGSADFGDVNVEELKMRESPLDSAADAIILFEKCEVQQYSNGTSDIKIHRRLKFFSRNAYRDWGSVHVTGLKSSITKVRAATYSLDGGRIKKTELTEDQVFKTKEGKRFETTTFTFPNLSEGAVAEFSYTLKSNYWDLPAWSFQDYIPVVWSEYIVKSFLFLYNSDVRGVLPVDETHDRFSHRWTMKDIPAFKPESLMPHSGIYLASIRFWRRDRTWEDICRRVYDDESFGGVLKFPRNLKAKAQEITAGITDPSQKVKAISNYMKNAVSWDGTKDYMANEVWAIFDKKTGTSGDINLIFGSLLRQAGLDVDMVLLSTHDHGLVLEQFPSYNQFDYVICRVRIGNTVLLLDATEKDLPYNVLPQRCLNYDGLVVNEFGPEWVKIVPQAKVKESVNAQFVLSETGSLKGDVKIIRDGYSAFTVREQYKREGKEEYVKSFQKNKSWLIQKSEILNIESVDMPVRENYEIEINDAANLNGDLLYVDPIVMLRELQNPFQSEKRDYPVDLTVPSERVYVATIDIPAGFRVDEIPATKSFKLPNNDASCVFSYSQSGNKLIMSFNLKRTKSLFFPNEYPALREFYGLIVAKMSEQIVLKKGT